MADWPLVCGIDEAGLGSWAGPLCAAAVVLDPDRPIEGLADSKRLSVSRRQVLREVIRSHAIAVGIGWSEAYEIDRYGLARANHRAMERAVSEIGKVISDLSSMTALIDGRANKDGPNLVCRKRFIVGGDASEAVISAASIIAKTSRDAVMVELDARYPGYDFSGNKGYGVAVHRRALVRLGPSPIHRASFRPVAEVIKGGVMKFSGDAAGGVKLIG